MVKQPKFPGALPLDPAVGTYNDPYEPPATRANMLTYVGIWPMTIKFNPS